MHDQPNPFTFLNFQWSRQERDTVSVRSPQDPRRRRRDIQWQLRLREAAAGHGVRSEDQGQEPLWMDGERHRVRLQDESQR